MHSPSYRWLSETAKGNFTAYPQCVVELCAYEWKREWGGEDAIGFVMEINSMRALREKHVEEARDWASNLDLRAENVREVCLSFPSKTAIGLVQHAFTDIAHLTDNTLESLARSSDNVLSSWQYQLSHFLQLLVLLGKKNGGSRTITILHTTYRLTRRLVSAHISQWDVKFSGKWESAQGRWASSWPTARVNM